MKKNTTIAAIAAASAILLCASCQKQELIEQNNGINATGKVFTATIGQGLTKTTITSDFKVNWLLNDEVSINEVKYTATPDASDPTKAALATTEAAPGKLDGKYKALYPYSLIVPAEGQNPAYFAFPAKQTYAPGQFNAPMYAESETEVFTFNNICGALCLSLKGTDKVKSISVTANEAICGAFTMTDATTVNLTGDGKTVTLDCGTEGVQLDATTATNFYIYLPPKDSYTAGMKIVATSTEGKTFEKTTAKAVKIEKNNLYTFDWDATFSEPAPAADYVEIGGVKWATKNLGATTVAGSLATCAGDYYAWGETEPYYGTLTWDGATGTFSDWKTGKTNGYAWQSYCGASSFTEWSTPPYDNTTKILKPDFDPAKQKLGDGWRMPTGNDFVALLTAGFAEWTSSYDNTGVAGIIFWKAKDGDAGWLKPESYSADNKKAKLIKSSDSGYSYEEIIHIFSNTYAIDTDPHVFFPAAGYGNNCDLISPNSQGLYFSSSLSEKNNNQVNGIGFNKTTLLIGGNNSRMPGGSIRPVSTESATPTPAPTLPACALAGEFSVSTTKKVHFSQGNLYYDGSAFKLEKNQYDVQSSWNTSHVSNFFWSKSASVAYAASYEDGSAANTDVFFTNATAETAKSDFTVNGVTGKYRTLSKDEWKYLFDTRTVNGGTGEGKSYSADITYGGKKGVVLYPDNYTGSVLSGTVTVLPEDVVFLPSTGYRDGGSIYEVSETTISCIYWTSTAEEYDKAYRMFFKWEGSTLSTDFEHDGLREWAVGIRLVTDVPTK